MCEAYDSCGEQGKAHPDCPLHGRIRDMDLMEELGMSPFLSGDQLGKIAWSKLPQGEAVDPASLMPVVRLARLLQACPPSERAPEGVEDLIDGAAALLPDLAFAELELAAARERHERARGLLEGAREYAERQRRDEDATG